MGSSNKSHPLQSLRGLPPKAKPPASVRILDSWLTALQEQTQQAGSRLAWLVSATVVIGALQRVVDDENLPVFVVKGGTSLHIQLGDIGRLTRDLDGIVRGHSFQDFLRQVDKVIAEPWGPISLRREKGRHVEVGPLAVPLFRFDMLLTIQGKTWRRIPVELSMEEGREGTVFDRVHAPPLGGLGLPTPESIVTLGMTYQIAQKIHAATAPHRPPELRNDRFRDVIDLVMLRRIMATTGEPSPRDVLVALKDVFKTRAETARSRSLPPRQFPPTFFPWPHWAVSFDRALSDANLSGTLEQLCGELNAWIQEIVSGD